MTFLSPGRLWLLAVIPVLVGVYLLMQNRRPRGSVIGTATEASRGLRRFAVSRSVGWAGPQTQRLDRATETRRS
jgi:hypothetical protein